MQYIVYIIQSEKKNLFKGFTQNLSISINYHNADKSPSTKGQGVWTLLFTKGFEEKEDALEYVKMLKMQTDKYIHWLVASNRNEIDA